MQKVRWIILCILIDRYYKAPSGTKLEYWFAEATYLVKMKIIERLNEPLLMLLLCQLAPTCEDVEKYTDDRRQEVLIDHHLTIYTEP